MQLVPPGTTISSDISWLIQAVSGLTILQRTVNSLQWARQEKQELDPKDVDAI